MKMIPKDDTLRSSKERTIPEAVCECCLGRWSDPHTEMSAMLGRLIDMLVDKGALSAEEVAHIIPTHYVAGGQ